MRIKDISLVGSIALGTYGGAFTVLGASESEQANPSIQTIEASNPNLRAGEVEYTVAAKRRGKRKTVVTVKARNMGNSRIKATATVALMEQDPAEAFSRMMALPVELAREELLVKLEPGEENDIELVLHAVPEQGEGLLELESEGLSMRLPLDEK